MPKRDTILSHKRLAIYTLVAFLAIFVLWTLSWIAKVYLFDQHEWFLTSLGGFVYWSFCKIVFWILPCFVMLKISNRRIKSVLGLQNSKWLIWGIIIGLILSAINVMSNILRNNSILPGEALSFASLNAFIIAPTFEEFLFRGVILDNLKKYFSFWSANIITSLFFLMIHIPGWYFMGTLQVNFLSFVGISIFLLSLVFGLTYKKGESVWSCIIVHAMNNIT